MLKITKPKLSGQALSESQLRLGIKVAGLGLGSVDYVADTITLDSRAAEFFDLVAHVPIARDELHARIHPDDRDEIKTKLIDLLNPGHAHFMEVQHRVVHADGTVLWLRARKEIEFGQVGDNAEQQPVSGLVAIIDITDFKAAQSRTQFLLDELNHRTKNLLGVIRSIARMTASSGDPSSFMERFSGRLQALAHNQDALVLNNWQHVEIKSMIIEQLEAFETADKQRIFLEGEEAEISPEAAQAIGLAIHELATNAMKYGALSGKTGQVDIVWSLSGDDEFVIRWTESSGPKVLTPTRSGFGQNVIKEMAESATKGVVNMHFREDGVRWELRMPLKRITPT